MFTRYSTMWAPGPALLAITLLHPSKTARPRAMAIAGAEDLARRSPWQTCFLLEVPNLAAPSDLRGIESARIESMERLHVESMVPSMSSHPRYGCSRAGLCWRRTPSDRWSFEGLLLSRRRISACKQPRPCSRDRCCGS